jgi:hypothetical protein
LAIIAGVLNCSLAETASCLSPSCTWSTNYSVLVLKQNPVFFANSKRQKTMKDFKKKLRFGKNIMRQKKTAQLFSSQICKTPTIFFCRIVVLSS